MVSKYLGGGFLVILGAVLTVQAHLCNSWSTSCLAVIVSVVGLTLLYSVWREL